MDGVFQKPAKFCFKRTTPLEILSRNVDRSHGDDHHNVETLYEKGHLLLIKFDEKAQKSSTKFGLKPGIKHSAETGTEPHLNRKTQEEKKTCRVLVKPTKNGHGEKLLKNITKILKNVNC